MTKQSGAALRWSTDHVAPGDRFTYWREALSANLIGMTPEAAPGDRKGFEGEITCMPIGDTAVMQLDMKISHVRMERSAADIRALPGDGVFLFRASTPDMNFQFHDRDAFAPAPGITVMGGLDRKRYSVVSRPGRYRCEVMRIPSIAFRGSVGNPALLEPREVDLSTGASSLLHGFFNSFLRELPRLSSLERETALTTLTSLAILSLQKQHGRHEPVREAVRAAALKAVQDHMIRYASDPTLSPATVARTLKISTRRLHGLFEPTSTTFSRFLAQERVRRAVHMLQTKPNASVSQIAFQCGFESLATFYRTFRAVAKCAPLETRHMGS